MCSVAHWNECGRGREGNGKLKAHAGLTFAENCVSSVPQNLSQGLGIGDESLTLC